MRSLEAYGWSPFFARQLTALDDRQLLPFRVVEDFGRIYRILGATGEIWAETSGRLRHRAAGAAALPAVGDWVLARPAAGDGRAVIQQVLERRSCISRKSAGERFNEQVLASNVDTVFVMQSLDGDFNVRRLERYLVAIREGGAEPVVLLTKSDLADAPREVMARLSAEAPGVPALAISCLTPGGLDALRVFLIPGQTVALLGSSGVGKSTLVNALFGHGVARVGEVRESDGRGRHTTTGRRLWVHEDGTMLVDTPGMRELGLWEGEGALLDTFDEIRTLAEGCRFRDCHHAQEPGCAVRDAASGDAQLATRLESWRKLQAELIHAAREQDLALRLADKGRVRVANKELKRLYKSRG